MNHTIIHDRAGLNQFYAKVYAFVGLGIGLSALVSGLMLTVFQSQLVYFLMQGRLWLTIATFAELALVFVASSMASKNSPALLSIKRLYPQFCGGFLYSRYSFICLCIKRPSLLCHGSSWYVHQERLEWDWSSDDGGSYWFTDCYGSQYFLG